MNVQDAKNLTIPEGSVKMIHDKDNRLLWGAVGYNTKYVGNTTQATTTGFQLLRKDGLATPTSDSAYWDSVNANLSFTNLGENWVRITSAEATGSKNILLKYAAFEWTVDTTYTVILEIKNAPTVGGITISQPQNATDPFASTSKTASVDFSGEDSVFVFSGVTKSSLTSFALRPFMRGTFSGVSVDLRLTIVAGNHTSDYQNYVGDNYEPYTNGPAPNPDFPETINVVTGVQTVTVSDGGSNTQTFTIDLTSKNMWNPTPYKDGYYINGTGVETQSNGAAIWESKTVNAGDTYTFSAIPATNSNLRAHAYDSSGNWMALIDSLSMSANTKNTLSITIPASTAFIRWSCTKSTQEAQLETGSTATSYQEYYDYELCKIGNYQDKIYKSGGDWYVHKETNSKVFSGEQDENWQIRNSGTANFYYTAPIVGGPTGQNTSTLYSNYGIGGDIRDATTTSGIMIVSTGTYVRLRYGTQMTLTDWNTKLSSTNMTLYYPLATPTDTKITDATLISQLNAVHQWLTRYGYNATVTGNLPIIIDRTNL